MIVLAGSNNYKGRQIDIVRVGASSKNRLHFVTFSQFPLKNLKHQTILHY